jgi:uncharacterized membrane protein
MNGAADHTRGIRRKAVSKNIDSIVALEKEDERKLSRLHRASHTVGWFVGTIHFVILQLFFVVAWVVWNAYGPVRFDPYPFTLLSAVLALEAVFLTSFVLIRQNTMDQRSERRNHLDLQINLLAEKEATSILHRLDAIAAKFGVEFPQDFEATELAKDTQVETIARDLRVMNDKTSP